MQPVTDVSVLRPDEYRVSPQWQAQVVESAVNVYKMSIDPLSFDENRCSYSFRSPGVGTILSPNLFIEMEWVLTFPGHATYSQMVSPIYQPCRIRDVGDKGDNADQAEQYLMSYAPKVCFSSGDGVSKSLTNYQLTINGASISNARQNTYISSLQRCWFGEKCFQRRFSQCGGKLNQMDAQPVSGEAYAHAAVHGGAGADTKVVAFTGDSGITARIENLLMAVKDQPNPDAQHPGTEVDRKIVVVRWPVSGVGIFSPLGPDDEQSVSSCYRSSCLALPHCNTIQLDLLFKDLAENLFRNLSSRSQAAGNVILTGTADSGVRARLMGGNAGETKPKLLATYIKLSSWRGLPASTNLQCFRCSVHSPTETTHVDAGNPGSFVPAAVTRSTVNRVLAPALQCTGVDRQQGREARAVDNRYLTANFKGVVSAQAPSYLAFVLEKSSDMFVLGGDITDDAIGKSINNWNFTAGRADNAAQAEGRTAGLNNSFLARNTDANAAITQFSLEIQASIGSYVFSGSAPYLRTRSELYRDHIRNVPDDYMDINKWFKHGCILLLGADSFLRGLCSPGTAFPITINASVTFISARQYIDGHGAAAFRGRGPAVFQDCIYGEPVMVQIYPGNSMMVSPSAALLSAQNLSHSQGIEILSRS